jgi:ABC-type lipoprotein release transport system permease subunit
MTSLPKLAWKNLFRYKRRTLITAAALAMGLLILILVTSLLSGIDGETIRNFKWYETADGVIEQPGYNEDRGYFPLDKSIPNATAVTAELRELGYKAAPRINFNAQLVLRDENGQSTGTVGVRGTGVDFEAEKTVFRNHEHYLSPVTERPGAVLGSWVAEDYGIEVGDVITLSTNAKPFSENAPGMAQTIDATVVGIIFTPNPVINRYGIYLDLEYVQFSLLAFDEATSIHILHEGKDRALIEDWAQSQGLVFNGWELLAKDFLAMSEMKTSSTGAIIGLLVLIALIGVTNTMIMAIYERTREIGTLRAMGMKDTQILWMFAWEGMGIGLLGSVMGLAAAFAMNFYIVLVGIDYSFILRQMDAGYRVATIMRGDWVPEYFVFGFFLSILISGFIAFVTAFRAVRKTIPQALQTN